MTIVHIEHTISDFHAWKQAFDSDPVGREKLGVRRYRILRATDDPNYVMIDLEFDSVRQAEALLAAMRVVWARAEQNGLIGSLQARMVEVVETKALSV